jgi:hypothetical protein
MYDTHNKIVQIHTLSHRRAFFYHAPDAPNHFTGTAPIRHDISKQVAELTEIDIAAIDKALPSAGVADNSGEGLIQFMGNGCGQFTHHCDSTKMADFLAAL